MSKKSKINGRVRYEQRAPPSDGFLRHMGDHSRTVSGPVEYIGLEYIEDGQRAVSQEGLIVRVKKHLLDRGYEVPDDFSTPDLLVAIEALPRQDS